VARAAGRRERWASESVPLAGVGVGVVACTDAAFPLNLRLVRDAPPLLFAQGALIDDDRHAVAIVGTRSPSAAGRALAAASPPVPSSAATRSWPGWPRVSTARRTPPR